ncbi:MAG: hypothetical protein KDA88_16765 [Planctomycetaceae bacterium]|nr:hypothetical protein [Planctomycetaceae bacterium]MCB9951856.1 hypothetical protein [Planctomycetaceae bacterium]
MRRSRHVFFVFFAMNLVLVCVNCSLSLGDEPKSNWKGKPSGIYAFLGQPYRQDESVRIRQSLPIKAFHFQKFGPPDLLNLKAGTRYRIEFHRDGTARYHGLSGVEKLGVYSGKIDLFDYGRLCLLYETLMKEVGPEETLGHVPGNSDPVLSRLTIQFADDQKSEYEDDANFGDFRFWVLENAIQRIYFNTEWTKIDEETPEAP